MLTVFAAPKPYRGHVALIQSNALRSWAALPSCEVILFGDEPGIAEAAADVGARHVPDVARSPEGVPLLSDVFGRARELAGRPLLAYANADIVLMDDVIAAAATVFRRRDRFLVVGRRTDLDVHEPLDTSRPSWQANLRERARREGTLTGPEWIDYFVFPRDLFGALPPFALGRAGFDNWLLWKARESGALLVDATPSVLAVHQNHDYRHHPQGKQGVWYGADAQRNLELIGDGARLFFITDADRVLAGGRLRPNPSRLRRRFARSPRGRALIRATWPVLIATHGIRSRLGLRRESWRRLRRRLVGPR